MRVMWCEDNIDSSTRETQPSAAKLNQMRKKQLFVTEDDDVNNGLCKYSNAAEARGSVLTARRHWPLKGPGVGGIRIQK